MGGVVKMAFGGKRELSLSLEGKETFKKKGNSF